MNKQDINEVIEGFTDSLLWACELDTDYQLSEEAREQIEIHCKSFYVRAKVWFDDENNKRRENKEEEKTLSDLGSDFYFTAFGHGVGFWEKSESDWLYQCKQLEKIAHNYWYRGASAYAGDDGLIYIG